MDLGALIRGSALAGSGYYAGREARRQREREESMVDEDRRIQEEERRRRIEQEKLDRQRQAARDALEEKRIHAEIAARMRRPFRATANGITQEFNTEEEAAAFVGRHPRAESGGTIRVNAGGVSREFPDTPEGQRAALLWRQTAEQAGGGQEGGGFSDASYANELAQGFMGRGGRTEPRDEFDAQTYNALMSRIRDANAIRQELISSGITDRETVEAEVQRRLAGG